MRPTCPEADGTTEKLTISMFKAVNRRHDDLLSKNEFVSISTQSLETLTNCDLSSIYDTVFIACNFEFGQYRYPSSSPRHRAISPTRGAFEGRPLSSFLLSADSRDGENSHDNDEVDQKGIVTITETKEFELEGVYEKDAGGEVDEVEELGALEGYLEVNSIMLSDLRCRGSKYRRYAGRMIECSLNAYHAFTVC